MQSMYFWTRYLCLFSGMVSVVQPLLMLYHSMSYYSSFSFLTDTNLFTRGKIHISSQNMNFLSIPLMIVHSGFSADISLQSYSYGDYACTFNYCHPTWNICRLVGSLKMVNICWSLINHFSIFVLRISYLQFRAIMIIQFSSSFVKIWPILLNLITSNFHTEKVLCSFSVTNTTLKHFGLCKALYSCTLQVFCYLPELLPQRVVWPCLHQWLHAKVQLKWLHSRFACRYGWHLPFLRTD